MSWDVSDQDGIYPS